MTSFRQIILRENNLVFFFSLAIIAGPALSILFANDLSQFTDCNTYNGLARFDFDQSPVRRYRVLIPFAAAFLNFITGGVFRVLAPTYFTGDFSLPFCFFLINTLLMSYFSVLVYRFCRTYHVSRFAAIVATLVVLSARYTIYFAALPLVDSLFCVVVGLTLVGIKEKNTGMLLCCIFLGPFAKESFLFIAPLIFFCSHLEKKFLFYLFLVSGLLAFSFHFFYDRLTPIPTVGWLKADLTHLPNLINHLPLLFSFYGIYKIFINIGFWILLPLAALMIAAGFKKKLYLKLDRFLLYFFLLVLLQMLLSGSFERMFYLALPLVSVIAAISFDELRKYILFSGISK